MEITKCKTVIFSPTGTTRRVALAVAGAMSVPVEVVDVTHRATAPRVECGSGEMLVVAVPVYGGHMPRPAMQRLEQLQGDNTPAVILAVYGNRAYEETLTQLDGYVRERGFVPVAAGAFVGEHSYSTQRYPIAVGRPDAADVACATRMGAAVRDKLAAATHLVGIDVAALVPPARDAQAVANFVAGIAAMRNSATPPPAAPTTDADACTHCGLCVTLCPAAAIAPGDELHTDAQRCIKCCACVKGCPQGARTFDTPFAPLLAANFAARTEPVTLL